MVVNPTIGQVTPLTTATGCDTYRLCWSASAIASVTLLAPSLGARRPNAAGVSCARRAPRRSGKEATVTSGRSRSIACTTAAPTSRGDLVRRPTGGAKPVSAHIPASAIGPGYKIETPTPCGASSLRSDSE